jgi:hypothetical protein
MAKNSGESMKTVQLKPKPQPSRSILHGFGPLPARTLPSAQGANKQADRLLPSPKRTSPARGKMWPQMVF